MRGYLIHDTLYMIHNPPNKLLGQHFLVSRDVLKKIIDAADIAATEIVLEIGPGHGVLTRELATRAKRVIAVEKDRLLADELRKKLSTEKISNVTIITGDVLKLTPRTLGLPKTFSVVANIPYYLTARLIRILLERRAQPEKMILMVQKEVADRILAKPPHMNLLALSVQVYGTPSIIAAVPPTAFSPRPEIDSAIIAIRNISESLFKIHKIEPKYFFAVIRAAFQHKRKNIANALEKGSAANKEKLYQALAESGIDPKRRPETLSIDEWITLAKRLAPVLP